MAALTTAPERDGGVLIVNDFRKDHRKRFTTARDLLYSFPGPSTARLFLFSRGRGDTTVTAFFAAGFFVRAFESSLGAFFVGCFFPTTASCSIR